MKLDLKKSSLIALGGTMVESLRLSEPHAKPKIWTNSSGKSRPWPRVSRIQLFKKEVFGLQITENASSEGTTLQEAAAHLPDIRGK